MEENKKTKLIVSHVNDYLKIELTDTARKMLRNLAVIDEENGDYFNGSHFTRHLIKTRAKAVLSNNGRVLFSQALLSDEGVYSTRVYNVHIYDILKKELEHNFKKLVTYYLRRHEGGA